MVWKKVTDQMNHEEKSEVTWERKQYIGHPNLRNDVLTLVLIYESYSKNTEENGGFGL